MTTVPGASVTLPRFDQGPLYVVYADLGQGPYQCPGNVIGTSFRSASDPVLVVQSSTSLDAFLDLSDDDPHGVQTRAAQTGALAHELGHALTLIHPTDPQEMLQTVMYSWWEFPGIAALPREIAQARTFLAAWPGVAAA